MAGAIDGIVPTLRALASENVLVVATIFVVVVHT